MSFEKGLLVLNNPKAGSNNQHITSKLKKYLAANHINYHVIDTDRANHGYDLAKTKDLSVYDAILTIGGDGTIHEIVNGLSEREDRVPLILMPQGTGNDLCRAFHLNTSEDTFKVLEKPSVISIDVLKITLDKKKEESKYSVINTCLGIPAKANHQAKTLKPYFGRHSYVLGALLHIITHSPEIYDIEVDGCLVEQAFDTSLMFICNGKHGGGG